MRATDCLYSPLMNGKRLGRERWSRFRASLSCARMLAYWTTICFFLAGSRGNARDPILLTPRVSVPLFFSLKWHGVSFRWNSPIFARRNCRAGFRIAREPVYCRLSLLGANCALSRSSTWSWLETSKVGLKPQHSHAHCLYCRKTCSWAQLYGTLCKI